ETRSATGTLACHRHSPSSSIANQFAHSGASFQSGFIVGLRALAFRLGRCRFQGRTYNHIGQQNKPELPRVESESDDRRDSPEPSASKTVEIVLAHLTDSHVAAFRPVTAQVLASERRIRPISSTSGKRLASVYRQIPLAC